MKRFFFALAVATFSIAPALSADLIVGNGGQCRLAPDAVRLTSISNTVELTEEVVTLMNDAILVAEDEANITSRSQAFNWANETKAACGKAYGYLLTQNRDEDYLMKCECFHQRMQSEAY
jgi:hypothetical protein